MEVLQWIIRLVQINETDGQTKELNYKRKSLDEWKSERDNRENHLTAEE